MMISLMSCILSGMPFDMEEENIRRIQDLSMGSALGSMFFAIDISAFISPEKFRQRTDHFIDLIKSCKPLTQANKIYMPGEKEFLKMEQNQVQGGFTIGPNLFTSLKNIAADYELLYDFSHWHAI